MVRLTIRFCQVAGAAFLLTAVCAAGPDGMHVQIGDLGPLGQPAAPAPAQAKVLSFQNTMYQAAPVPDPDVLAPPGVVETEAQLSARFMSPTSLPQGDGYSYASSEQGTIERRKMAAAGLGLSVPVDQ